MSAQLPQLATLTRLRVTVTVTVTDYWVRATVTILECMAQIMLCTQGYYYVSSGTTEFRWQRFDGRCTTPLDASRAKLVASSGATDAT